jgi:hypothetical protein
LGIENAPRSCEQLGTRHSESYVGIGHVARVAASHLQEEISQFLSLALRQCRTQLLRADPKAAKNPIVYDRLLVLKTAKVELDVDRVDPAWIEKRLGEC